MGSYDAFEATHRVVASSDDAVASCKRALASHLSERATELRVFVHPTEWPDAPEAVTALPEIDPGKAEFEDGEFRGEGFAGDEFAGDERVLRSAFPDAERVVEAAFAEMDDAGRLPASSLYFGGDGVAALVTASTSHLHVGKLRCEDATLADELSDALNERSDGRAGVGVVVPAGPVLGWNQEGTYVELDGPMLCVYDERPAGPGARATTHACHDLTRLAGMDADGTSGRIELSWRDPASLVGRGLQLLFGRPPTELAVPAESFDAVEAYLDRFLVDQG